MCQIDTRVIKNPDGTREAFITCKTSGKPITVSNEYGMFCEDLCNLEENKKLPGPKELTEYLMGFFKDLGFPKIE